MAEKRSLCARHVYGLFPFYVTFAVSLGIIGIYLICVPNNMKHLKEHVIDYTNCKNSVNEDQTCFEYIQLYPNMKDCSCLVNFKLNESFEGNVTVSYELDSFDLSQLDLTSRDDRQLGGDLSNSPSENCGQYRYVEEKPILPCGEVADYMFSDVFRFENLDESKFLTLQSGSISAEDKLNFQNPANLSEFEKYVQPKSWFVPIQNLQRNQNDNYGLENERFISWMMTDWIRKPIGLVRPDPGFVNGIPSGRYQLRVGYNYPLHRYNGTRKVILSAPIYTENNSPFILGIIAVFGSLILIVLITISWRYRNEPTEKVIDTEFIARIEQEVAFVNGD